MSVFDLSRWTSPHERAQLVCNFTAACSLIYHTTVLILFFFLKVYPLFYFNIFSIATYIFLLVVVPKFKTFIVPYLIAVIEVVAHQMIADYYLGSNSSFHFFILLMGLLPFLIFEDRFRIVAPLTFITSITFILYEIMDIPPVYEVNRTALTWIKHLNITMTIFIIIVMVFIYTLIVTKIEGNLQKQNKTLESEIKMAAAIQRSFFKQTSTAVQGWDTAYHNAPMAGVSGDLYDLYNTGGRLDGLGIFDVSGHGISSGLVTMLVKNIIHQEFYRQQDLTLDKIMEIINERVNAEKGDIENYLTGILLRINGENIEYVNAGHPMPLIFRKSTGSCEYLKKHPASIGAIGFTGLPTFYVTQKEQLSEGDEIVLFTDGITDTLNEKNETFGYERFRKMIQDSADLTPGEQIDMVMTAIEKHRGSQEVKDDSTIMIIKKTS